MATYKLYPAAVSDLEQIWRYSFDRWGINQAELYTDDLISAFQMLANTPSLSRERDEFSPPVRIHPHARHLIVYLQADHGIDIVRVLHESMDVDTQLAD